MPSFVRSAMQRGISSTGCSLFFLDGLTFEDEFTMIFETIGTARPVPQNHNPEDLIITSVPQQPVSRTLFCHIGPLYESSGTCIYMCHRRNGPNFGRVFLMLNYTDITQNTYVPS